MKKERKAPPIQTRAVFSINTEIELRDECQRVADSIGYSRNQFIEAALNAVHELIKNPNSLPLVIDLARHRRGK